MLTLEPFVARRIRIRGLVQGIGLRPAVHRLATALTVNGWVCNDGNGVTIHVEGCAADLDSFVRGLPSAIPSAAQVEAIVEETAVREDMGDFRIRASASTNAHVVARIPQDRALCADCRADVLERSNR